MLFSSQCFLVKPLNVVPATTSTSAKPKTSLFASTIKVNNAPAAGVKQESKIKKESPQKKSPQKSASPQKKDTSKKVTFNFTQFYFVYKVYLNQASATKVTNGKSLASFFSSKPVKKDAEANKSIEEIAEVNKSKEKEEAKLNKSNEEEKVTQIKSKEEEKPKPSKKSEPELCTKGKVYFYTFIVYCYLSSAAPEQSRKTAKQEESNKNTGHKRKISNIIGKTDVL